MLPSILDRPALLPAAPTTADIERLAAYMLMLETEHGTPDLQTAHHRSGGVYGRSVVVKAGTVLVGLPHKEAGLAVCVGDITVWSVEHGEQRLTGAHILQTTPGDYRVGLAHADTTWLNVHAVPADATISEIEDRLVEGADRLMTRRNTDHDDYRAFLEEFGFSESFVRGIVEDMRDHADMPPGFDHIETRSSPIQGVGVFSSHDFMPGESIGPARIGFRRTVLGRRTNHAAHPNCKFEADGAGGLQMVATKRIPAGSEMTINYRQAAQVNGSSGRLQ